MTETTKSEVTIELKRGDIAEGLMSVRLVRFVLWGEDAMNIHEQAMDNLFG